MLRLAGAGLLLAGVGLLVASVTFPTETNADSYRELTAAVLNDARWQVANWFFLVSMLIVSVALWALADSRVLIDEPRAVLAVRAMLVSAIFLSVDMAVLVAAYSEREAYRAGELTPLVDLGGTMDAIGWPIFGLGAAALALILSREHRVTPGWAGILGALGGLTIGLAALFTAGFHVVDAAVLYVPGVLLWAWFIWAGLNLLRGRQQVVARVAGPVAA
jgi:hypothetical protein